MGKLVVGVIVAVLGLFVVWYVLGWLSLFIYTLVILAIAAAVVYGLSRVVGKGKIAAKKSPDSFRLSGRGKQIYVFHAEPSLKDLVNLHNDLHVAQLELAGDVYPVERDTPVIVLEDNGKEFVKIRIKSEKGKKSKLDSEGWIDRSNLIADAKKISG